MRKCPIILLSSIAIILPYVGMIVMHKYYEEKLEQYNRVAYAIIDKGEMSITIYDFDGEKIADFPIGCGKAFGDKIKKGDNRTPEGVFRIVDIQNSSEWSHDFNDGKGDIKGAYGPYFIRLNTDPHKGIGIHGTHHPESIGTRCTEGCIRLSNEDVIKLHDLVYYGMNVIIIPSYNDILENNVQKYHTNGTD